MIGSPSGLSQQPNQVNLMFVKSGLPGLSKTYHIYNH